MYFTAFVLVTVAVCDAELKLEATDGENLTIPLEIADLDRADQVKIEFMGERGENELIAQFCRCAHCRDCNDERKPGVLLRVDERTLILQNVNSSNSGLYEAKALIGKVVSNMKASVVIKKPAFSSTKAPLHTSTVNPPSSSQSQWLYVLVIPVIILGVVVCLSWRSRCKREREPLADVEEARETPAVSRPSIFKKNYWKRNCSDCAAVSFKACTEDTDDQLVDT